MKHYKTYKIRKKMLLENLSGWIFNQVYISGGYSKLVAKIKIIDEMKTKTEPYHQAGGGGLCSEP